MRKTLYLKIMLLLSIAFVQVYAEKKAFSIEDLYKIQNVGSPVLSPDGSQIAFTLTRYTLEKGKSLTSIWLMDANAKNQVEIIVGDKSCYNPIWAKNGKSLYYSSTEDETSQVYLYNIADKSTKKITDFSMGVNDPVLSPDNKLIAFSAEVYPECGADSKANALTDSLATNGPTQAYMADKLLFRHWTDYAAGKCSHIILYDIENQSYTDMTPGNYASPIFMLGGGIGYNFSPDSKELCYISNHDEHPEASTNSDLFLVSVTGGEAVNITSDNKAWDGSPTYSPDGKYIAYRKQLIPGYESDLFRLTIYDRQTGKSTMISEKFDNWVNDYKWSNDAKSIYFLSEVVGRQPLYKIDIATQKITPMSGEKTISSFEIDKKDNLYFTASTTGKPTAMYKMKLPLGNEEQMTNFNEELENTVDIRPADTMWVAGSDGKKLEVFLVKPHNFDPSKKYPLVMNVHGGPQSQWMNSFRGDWQVYPGAGYVLAYPNPHGSTGYGQEYTRAISGDWGGKPFEDLMKVTDALANLSYVDSTRMGAMGWSYGGYMMNWFQAKTKRFKCLASMMGLYDLRSMWGTTEELWFPNFDLQGQPWNSDLYKKFSPSEYVENFATPTLIVTGQLDFRVSYTQSLQYFSTLQTLGIPSRIIILKNDGHWPNNVKSMPLYYDAHLDWFHKYLGGDPAPYDVEKLVKNQIFTKE
ncbi:MAG: S9 family peptidase [Paludibacter sp.]|nr:S9 family peptidase [Paludibacter sp.]